MRTFRLSVVLVVLTGCRTHDHQAASKPADAAIAPPPVSSARLDVAVDAILSTRCTPCHAWSSGLARRMTSACAGGGPLVVPFAPERSPLYLTMSGSPPCGASMPPDVRLPSDVVSTVREWIATGATVEGVDAASIGSDAGPVEDWVPVMN